jgi:acetylornithine deacetylase/succinyl-diaminopimelate desuccinylase-like protein
MTDHSRPVMELARDLVTIDSRSFVSNHPIADRIEAALAGFELERLDYQDGNGVEKRALVAHRGPKGGAAGGAKGGLALSGHMDTVPDTGWRSDPWSGRLENGRLYGLGSTDMKGPMAAALVAASALPEHVPITLLLTTDEETTKAGAREIAQRSMLAKAARPRAILVVEPTKMIPMRGHRVHVQFTAVATGIQAHSSTGRGRNANWELLPFLVEMRAIHERLRKDPDLQDPAYDPPFSDFNLVVDNHGSARQRDGAKGDRNHQVPLQCQSRSSDGRGHGSRCCATRRSHPHRGAGRRSARACAGASVCPTVQRGGGHRARPCSLRDRCLRAAGFGALRDPRTRGYRAGGCSRGMCADCGLGGGGTAVHATRTGNPPGSLLALQRHSLA